MDLAKYIRDIPDFPKPGILFKDITPLLAEPEAFRQAIAQMRQHYRGRDVDAVAAAEARGFLFAAPLALDVLEDPQRGLLVNEINHTMEFHSTVPVTGVDIPGKIVDYTLAVAERRVEAGQ